MAGKLAKAVRRANALQRLSATLDVSQADLQLQGRGDPELALIVTLERVADAVEGKSREATPTQEPPRTIETVKAEPLKTTETVEIVEADSKPKSKAAKESKDAN